MEKIIRGKLGNACKMQGIEREKYHQINVCSRTNSGDHGPEDAAGQNACISVLHVNEAQNCGPEHSCLESSGLKNCQDRPFRRQVDNAERITATAIMSGNNMRERAME
jgi:hypothetical protein